MQAAWGHSARVLIDRAFALAVERGHRVSTLHLAAAMLEDGGTDAKFLMARGLREQDLRSAGKVHPEAPGTFERVQSLAKRIAASRASETGPVHLLVAALSEPASALACMAAQLGCDPALLADEALRGANRSNRGPIASSNAIIHSGSTRRTGPAPESAPATPQPTPQQSRPSRSNVGAPPGKIISNRGSDSSGTATRGRGGATRSHGINAPGSKETPTNGDKQQRLIMESVTPGAAAPPSARIIVVGKDTSGRSASGSQARSVRPERTEHDLDARTFPAITLLARNLSADSVRGSLDPVVGREREVRRVLDAVARREGRGAIVVGPSGVGKSTLVRAVARENTGRAVLLLRHSDVAAQARGPQGAERARKLVDELLRVSDRILLALDPVAPWFLNRDVPDEVVLELRAALASGKLAWIGTATVEDARRLTEVEPWIERAAMRIELEEPTSAELREMVRAFAPAISAHHGVVAEPTVLERAAELSERYLGGRAQPDRALSVIDLALARARRARLPALSRDNVAEVVAELGGLPVDRVAATDGERLLAIESTLASRVVGHSHAITRVAQTLRRNAVGFRGGRPIGTFLFLGPTGVGKTETAKAIAEALFPGSGAMTRFDMAEFSEPHAVARLVGAPPGYVGHADGGQLTEAVRRRPYQLILLDEIEKAHRDVLESLLALLDEGRMTDGRGRTVDCRNTVIVMTSNLGAELYDRKATVQTRTIGFAARESDPSDEVTALSEKVRDAARAALPPELWNRIDDPVVFAPLARDEVREIAWRLLNQSFARLEAEQGTRLVASQALVDLLLENGGFEPSLGARPMRRAIARLVEAPIADAILRGTFRRGDSGSLAVRDWGVEVIVERAATPATDRSLD